MRDRMVQIQDQLDRKERDHSSSVSGCLADVRARDQLSAQLLATQQELQRSLAENHKLTMAATQPNVTVGSTEHLHAHAVDTLALPNSDDANELRAALLHRDQQLLELTFSTEAHEVTIAHLRARLRDQSAYKTLVAITGGANTDLARYDSTDKCTPQDEGGGEEAYVAIEKMQHIIANLRKENHELHKDTAKHRSYAALSKDNAELNAAVGRLENQVAGLTRELDTTRKEAGCAFRVARELSEAQQPLQADNQCTETPNNMTEQGGLVITVDGTLGSPSLTQVQLAQANAELTGQLHAARLEKRALLDELVAKGNSLVDVGSQLSQAIQATAAAEDHTKVAEENTARMAEFLRNTKIERDELQAIAQDQGGRLSETQQAEFVKLETKMRQQSEGAIPEAVASENIALRAENDTMAAELGALSPQFFEEIEDLKYAYAATREQLSRYEQQFGVLT